MKLCPVDWFLSFLPQIKNNWWIIVLSICDLIINPTLTEAHLTISWRHHYSLLCLFKKMLKIRKKALKKPTDTQFTARNFKHLDQCDKITMALLWFNSHKNFKWHIKMSWKNLKQAKNFKHRKPAIQSNKHKNNRKSVSRVLSVTVWIVLISYPLVERLNVPFLWGSSRWPIWWEDYKDNGPATESIVPLKMRLVMKQRFRFNKHGKGSW